MTEPKYAPRRADGLLAYVVTRAEWGQSRSRIELAEGLTDAKAKYGYTRERHTRITVRRATPADVAELGQ